MTLEALRAAPGGVRVPLETRYRKYAEPEKDGVPAGFATPTRKVELYSETFLEHGYPPLPEYQEPLISPVSRPDLASAIPLVLTCAKNTLFCESQHRGAAEPAQAAGPSRGRAASRDRGAARGIADGDWVTIETPEGPHPRARPPQRRASIRASCGRSTAGGRPARARCARLRSVQRGRAPTSTC